MAIALLAYLLVGIMIVAFLEFATDDERRIRLSAELKESWREGRSPETVATMKFRAASNLAIGVVYSLVTVLWPIFVGVAIFIWNRETK